MEVLTYRLNNDLYLGPPKNGKRILSVVPDDVYAEEMMFRVRWPDGVLSEDFYNISRAKDNAKTIAIDMLNKHHGESHRDEAG